MNNSTTAVTSLSTAALRRLKKKRQREREQNQSIKPTTATKSPQSSQSHIQSSSFLNVNGLDLNDDDDKEEDPSFRIEFEYVSGNASNTIFDTSIPSEYSEIFNKFKLPSEAEIQAAQLEAEDQSDEAKFARYLQKQQQQPIDEDLSDVEQQQQQQHIHDHNKKDSNEKSLSKRKLKKMLQVSLAALKEYSRRPEIVEWEDVTAKDPKFLIQLKCVRNGVPVPKHWSRKRKYLAGKRGFVKAPFELPAFIKATGIGELRDSMREQDSAKSVKVRAREKMHPKMGRMSIDYERLHDAFFLHQTKPKLTKFGDLYFEGKELEGRLKDKRPGYLSEELRSALGMTSLTIPPPWIFSMQKYGPPPSYPHLRIPGLNAPIPEGAQWGFHPGGWGKPPVNDPNVINFTGRLAAIQERTCPQLLEPINKNIWGEFEPEEEEEEGEADLAEEVTPDLEDPSYHNFE